MKSRQFNSVKLETENVKNSKQANTMTCKNININQTTGNS